MLIYIGWINYKMETYHKKAAASFIHENRPITMTDEDGCV